MSTSILSQAGRFNPGSELWIVPPIQISRQTLQIDWYLNFQISQARLRKKATCSPELSEVLKLTELDFIEDIKSKNNCFMIAAAQQLPCRFVVVIDFDDDLKSWTKDLHQTWIGLGQPSLRVFLPPEITANKWSAAWKSLSSFEEMTVVLDS